jgi:membrane protein DedA with SNARE-associated domain
MEGKAALFKRFADVDAWPVCLDTQDVDEIVRTVQIIAPVYGGINLEDISAPRCFEIEARLRELLDIPVFHDDQHGTAIVVLAALTNALKLVKKDLKSSKIVLSGVGAAGTAVARLLVAKGAKNIIGFDKDGLVFEDKGDADPMRKWFVTNCSPGSFRGDIHEAMKDADVFIGVSAPNVLNEADIKSMAKGAIVFALANPDPEIDPALARKHAAVVATGRSDQPNQINNVLAFPGIFRGLLDAGITKITDSMLVLAAEAIASCVAEEQLNANFIVPSVFDLNVVQKVAAAVKNHHKLMLTYAASFDEQLSPVAPFLFYVVIAGIIFVETGLLLGFFLPGDSLLFSAGLVAAARDDINIAFLVLAVFLAAFVGDQVGYVIGRKVGRPYLEKHKSPRMQRMLARSERFYERYGWWSVVIARYIPWVRTFVPPIAGTVKMNYYKFLSANALGAFLWGVGITLAGFYSGSIPWVKDISYALAAFFITASLLSALVNYLREKRD